MFEIDFCDAPALKIIFCFPSSDLTVGTSIDQDAQNFVTEL